MRVTFGLCLMVAVAMVVPARGQTSGTSAMTNGMIFGGAHTYAENSACPAAKPHKRTVSIYPTIISCTLVACPPRLVCSKDSDRCSYVSTDCNRCAPEPQNVEICLSQEELDNAK